MRRPKSKSLRGEQGGKEDARKDIATRNGGAGGCAGRCPRRHSRRLLDWWIHRQSDAGKTSGEPIKIGAIVSLTGTYAGLGDPEKKTIEMEVKRINEAGGINGRPVEVIFEDDGTDEAKAVAAASKLIEQDKVVALIGATGTGQSMAIRSEVDRAGIPQLSMAGGSAITAKLDPLVFQTPWSNTLVVPFTLEYLKKEGITKIGVISDTGGFGKDGAAVLAADAPGAGVTIVSNQTFNVGDADMTAQLTNIKKSGAQAVVMWTSGKEAATIAKNAKQLGLTIPLYGSHGNASTGVHRRSRGGCRGVPLRRRQDPSPRELRQGHRRVQDRHRFRRPLHQGIRSRSQHLRRSRLRRPLPARGGRAPDRGRDHARGTPRPGREDQGVHGHRRIVHVLADGPQRHDEGRPQHV